MRKTSIIAAVALVTSFGLVGCGSSDSSSTSSAPTVGTSVVSGQAIDPELVGATVCLDINQDGICNENEPSVTTDEMGTYRLELSDEQFNGGYPLIAINGIDKESGEAFKGKLFADITGNYQNITPLTTLAYEEMYVNMEKLKSVLGLTSEEIQANIIALANEGNTRALQVALTLQKSAEAIAPTNTIQFYKDLAQQINNAGQAETLASLILQRTPENLKVQVSALMETILESRLSDAYALAYEARIRAIELGIDHMNMLEMLPDFPVTPDAPVTPDTPEIPDTPMDIPSR